MGVLGPSAEVATYRAAIEALAELRRAGRRGRKP
jgi:hypothetical protein